MNLMRIFHKPLLATTALVAVGSACLPALADGLPTGGSVAAGSATIQQSAGAMTITQQSGRAVINWNGFSVGQGNTVTFVQPGSNAAILNRVTGSSTSDIAGSVSGNGQVYLVNPNGIAITPTGQVNVGGGFVASTLDIDDDDFMAGDLRFKGNGASAGVSNSGSIAVGSGGYAALMGGKVRNDGVISVPLGKVALGSGEAATLDLSGDGFLQVSVPTAAGAEGGDALIENGGRISADGGSVEIRAATARQAARHAINIPGAIEANSVGGRSGAIVIGGGAGGRVAVSGKVSAKGTQRKGGRVEVTGREVVLKAAEIDAAGDAGGGVVRVGGGYQGGEGLMQADTTLVDADSVIHVDATEDGAGGNVVVWAEGFTAFDGLITARGAGSGAGGDAEVSGKARLAYNGRADLRAENAPAGTLLLDPYDLRISNTGATNSNVTTTTPITSTGTGSVLNVQTLRDALWLGSVTIQTGAGGSEAGNIFWEGGNDVTLEPNTTLTLKATNNIEIQSYIKGGNLSFLVLDADSDRDGNGQAFTSGGGQSWINVTAYTNPKSDGTVPFIALNNAAISTRNVFIDTYQELQGIASCVSCNFIQTADIDAADGSTYGFDPILNYSGNFDGRNHVVFNLTIKRPAEEFVGLFGTVNEFGVVQNIRLVNAYVQGGDSTGALVGSMAGRVENAASSGIVLGNNNVGGLVGNMNAAGVLRYAGSSASVGVVTNGNGDAMGGLVGHARDTTNIIEFAFATGTVDGKTTLGGLIGASRAQMNYVYATGAVRSYTNDQRVGGLVGGTYGARIFQSYATGTVTTSSGVKGALAGYMDGSSRLERSVYNSDVLGSAWGVRDSGADTSQVYGVSTADFNNPTLFMAYFGAGTGVDWDFNSIWSPPINGTPRLYSVNPVVWIKTGSASTVYGSATTAPITVGEWHGGPGAFIPVIRSGQSEFVSLPGTIAVDPNTNVGTANETQTALWTNISILGIPYQILFAGTLSRTVTKAPLTVTAIDKSKTYDGGAHFGGNGVTYSGFVNGQNSSVLGGILSYVGNSQGAVNVGSYTITPAGYTSNNYAITYQSGTLNVAQKPLTASLTGPIIKTYDGTRAATLTLGNYQLSGRAGNDDVFLNAPPLMAEYDSAAVGSNRWVTVNGLTLGGAAAFNYTVNWTASNPVGQIDRRALTASLIGTISKTYDGSNGATLTPANYQLVNWIAGDQVYLQAPPLTGTYESVNVGSNIKVTANGLTLGGNEASNYTVNWTASGNVGRIDQRLLTLSLTGDVIKTYDRSRTATLSDANYGVLSGIVAGDDVRLLSKPTAGTYDTANVGSSKSVEITGLSLTGNHAFNYRINPTASANIGRIDALALTASLIGEVSKPYDRTDAATLTVANYKLEGVLTGDTVSLQSPPTAGTYQSVTAGTNIRVTVNGLAIEGPEASNYTVNSTAFANIGEIRRRMLTQAMVGVVARTYDGSDVATLTDANYGVLNGIIGPDIVSLSSKPSAGTYDTRAAGSGKTVTINGLTLQGADSGNYMIESTLSANIGQIYTKALTVDLAGEVAKTYDGNTTATLTLANYALNGAYSFDDVSLQTVPTSGAYDVATAGTNILVTASGFTLSGADAANYAVAASASGSVGRIDRRALTVSLVGNITRDYDGTTAATLTAGNYGPLVNVVSGDTVDLLSKPTTGTFDSRHAGTGKRVEVTGLTLTGADAGNYTIDLTAFGNIGQIDAKQVTAVLSGEIVKTYDGTNAVSFANGGYALAGTYGFDDVGLVASGGAYDTADVGTGKTITATGLSLTGNEAANYALSNSSVSGPVGRITPAALTITAIDVSKVYDGAGFSGGNGLAYLGFVNNETVAELGGALSYGGSAQGAVAAGSYTISASGYTSTNYTIAYVDGTLTVSPRPIMVAANDLVRTYGAPNPALTYRVTSGQLVGADAFDGSLSTAATAQSDPGLYAIEQGSLGLNSNYSLAFLPGVLTIQGQYTPVVPGGPTIPYIPSVPNDTIAQGVTDGSGQASANPSLKLESAWGASGLGSAPRYGVGAGYTADRGTISVELGNGEPFSLSQEFVCLGTTNFSGACASLGGGNDQ
ncbi:hypothetical protein AWJ14_00840 [Hoeflea olei]|uniref:Filamentous haemagglutinin FhaB/tRNA nuclease CdiA-like TPS domain-containing protein n=2 Tax=Hoeflea olei TaxID=1480615 RepID=A0A1C1YVE6_9HYPH|nr:hypothetical protein AWJ14_00840 [Hoeflea olei]